MNYKMEISFTRLSYHLLDLFLLLHLKDRALNFITFLLHFYNLPPSTDFPLKPKNLNYLKNLLSRDGILLNTKPNKSSILIKLMELKYPWLFSIINKDSNRDLNLSYFMATEDSISLFHLGFHLTDLLWWIILELTLLLLILEEVVNMVRNGINKGLKRKNKMFLMILLMQENI